MSSVVNEHLLQVDLEIDEYFALIEELEEDEDDSLIQKWQMNMPLYTIARCPFCAESENVLRARIDTYSLALWMPFALGGVTGHVVEPCRHFIAAEVFINLNGNLPSELPYFRNNSEVPYVIPALLRDSSWQPEPGSQPQDLHPKAVMHALPICRIEDSRFVPRYNAYIVSYFGEHHTPLWNTYSQQADEMAVIIPVGSNHPDFPYWWDLGYWARAGRLLWLDASIPDLPIAHASQPFPYLTVQGRTEQITYRKGAISQIIQQLRSSPKWLVSEQQSD